MNNVALIVAAGRGYRVGGAIPKQYLGLGGCAILRRTILAFQAHPGIGAVQVLIHPDDRALYEAATAGLTLRAPLHGGASRQESVRNGLEGIADLAPAHVLITDAVRPFVTAGLISDVLAALETHPGAIAAVPLADTLKRGAGGMITGTVDRAHLFRAQTPQGFRYAAILAAHRAAAAADGPELTDDAMVAERAGLAVALVAGSEDNFKITTAQDLARAEAFLGQMSKGAET
jgi:2-C-methyl-D-erythritol 4-phosphate cytidylyltransferase/2-C-methyl-D-erythritol 2,4-cyclodiphosphate synthase